MNFITFLAGAGIVGYLAYQYWMARTEAFSSKGTYDEEFSDRVGSGAWKFQPVSQIWADELASRYELSRSQRDVVWSHLSNRGLSAYVQISYVLGLSALETKDVLMRMGVK